MNCLGIFILTTENTENTKIFIYYTFGKFWIFLTLNAFDLIIFPRNLYSNMFLIWIRFRTKFGMTGMPSLSCCPAKRDSESLCEFLPKY